MAKRIVDEEMRFTVIVNGNSAKKELFDLEKANRSLTSSNKDLRAERAKLISQGKKGTDAYKRLSAEIKQNNATIKANKSRMEVLQKQIGITGLTMRQLERSASVLRLKLKDLVPGSAKYTKYKNDLKRINTQLAKLRLNGKAAKSSISKIADGFNKYAVLGASVIATGTGVVLSLQKLIDFNGKLSDAQSNVEKTTGLAKEEVKELTKEFGLLKTRTARIELLKLAEEAGRLGIEGKANIQEFVGTANKIKLALGDDLSDVQIREVGKIAKIYKVGERNNRSFAESFESLGSSINEVSASGANQADFLVDFLKRTGGISDVANISAQDMIGLAAAFDEAGQSQEISATAINKAYGSMAEESEKFAKVAGVSAKEFSKLLREDANEALILFLEGLKKGNPSLEEMAERLDGIELGGTRGAQAISALAANTDNLRKKQELANNALLENESLSKEAALREENLAAQLEKVQRAIRGIFVSESVVNGLTNFVEWFSKFIGASEDADGSVTRFRNRLVALLKAIIVITAAIVSYNTAVKLATVFTGGLDKTTKLYIITQKVATASTHVLRAATLLMTAAFNLVTLNITRARAAMVLFNRSLILSPIGLIVAAIGAGIAAYYLFSDASEKAATSQNLLNSAMAEADKKTAETIKNKQLLLDIARDETISLKQRQDAIDELNRIVPEYNGNLSLETVNTTEAKAALDKHIESLKLSAITYVLQERIKKKAIELADLENSALEDNIEWYEKLWAVVKNGGNAMGSAIDINTKSIENKYETIAATKEEIAVLEELYKTQLKNNPNQSSTGNTGPREGDTKIIDGKTFIFKNGQWVVKRLPKPPGKPSNKINQAKKEAEALLKLQRETEDARIALIQDAFQREMAQNDINQARKLEDLQKASDDILIEYDKAISSGNTDLASVLLKQYHELYDQIEMLDEKYQANRADIIEKGIETHIKQLQKQYDREEQERIIAHNNAMAALGTNEKAKQELQAKFDKDKLERQKENQQALINELKKIIDVEKFEDFKLDILSDEQLQSLKDRLASLGLSLSEINKLLSAMQNGDNVAVVELAGIGIDGNDKVDILGMSDDQWSKMFERTETLAGLIGKMGQIANASAQAYAMYDQFVTASENKRLNKIEAAASKEIEKQGRLLDNKLISQRQHDAAVKAQEDKVRKAQLEMEYKQAKRQKAINVATILGNQAVAVSKALAQGGFVLGIPWAKIVGVFAGLQLALALAQPLPAKGFEQGFYGNTMAVRREQDGKLFNAGFGGESRSGVVDKPTVFLAGEGGKNFPELIINGPDLKQFNPDLKKSLYREIRRVRGYEDGFYSNDKDVSSQDDDSIKMLMMSMLKENILVLTHLKENGVIAVMDKDLSNVKKLRDEFEKLEKIERKSTIVS